MDREARARARARILVAAVVVAGGSVLALEHSTRPGRVEAPSDVLSDRRPATTATCPTEDGRASPVELVAADGASGRSTAEAAQVARGDPPADPPPVDARPGDTRARTIDERARTSVEQLAETLTETLFDPGSADRHAAALAGSLGAGAATKLCELAADLTRPAAERVAAAEILRCLTDDGASVHLAPTALAGLRAVAADPGPEPPLAAFAARALARFGEPADRMRLVELLAGATSDAARAAAIDGLRAARDEDTAVAVARVAASATDPRVAEASCSILVSLTRDEGLAPAARRAAATALAASLEEGTSSPPSRGADAQAERQRRGRVIVALARLDPKGSLEPLLAAVRDAEETESVARTAALALGYCADARTTQALEHLLADPATPAARRVLATEALALKSGPDARSRASLEVAARDDPDPSVRSAATRALRRIEGRER